MDTIKPLFTATATATGGRNGHTQTSDGIVKADLSVPKDMGGPGKPNTATPEHLFAAGYAACFGGALDLVAEIASADLVVMVAAAGGSPPAASVIGEACALNRVMTTALIVDARDKSDAALARTLAALRPYASMLVVADGEDYIEAMLEALRA